jgi:hypothetical protein
VADDGEFTVDFALAQSRSLGDLNHEVLRGR